MIVPVTQTKHPVPASIPLPQTTGVQSITDTSLKGQRITSPTVFASPIFVSSDEDSFTKKLFKYTPIFIHDLPSDQNYKTPWENTLPILPNIKIPFIPNLLTLPFLSIALTMTTTNSTPTPWNTKLPPPPFTSHNNNSLPLPPPSQL